MRTSKVIDIALSEEKFYFPSETIRGSVIVQPKSSIRANSVTVKFSGSIVVSDKECISLFQTHKQYAVGEGKTKLELKPYNFPFEFLVPDNLPSALDFGKKKLVRIEYKLTAVLDRPMMLESLCPKIEYPVTILEYVDVTKDTFNRPVDKEKVVSAANCGQCRVQLSVPRSGYTRGETVAATIVVGTNSSYVRKNALIVDLIRKIKIQTAKNKIEEEHVLKSSKYDLNIIGPYNFSQSTTSQLIIRNTPPTVRYKGKILKIHYKIRAKVILNDEKTSNSTSFVELPIVVGTWPPADVPIDDDDDEDIIQYMGEMTMSDNEDDLESEEWVESSISSDVKRQNSNASNGSRLSDNIMFSHSYMNRSSSTPDLLISPVPQQLNNRYSSYKHKASRSITTPIQHRRMGSEDSNYQRNVPSHTLTYLSSTPNNTLNMSHSNTRGSNISTPLDEASSSDDDDDDDDLLAIIQKKKKKEEKELREKQNMLYLIN
ncbi:hypothetical protein BY458DRAFT_12083 [Sporodiniella umbellata]|nr:hypothetical protein BY458DRAFT_12083 [Sporodiniella umbellata]